MRLFAGQPCTPKCKDCAAEALRLANQAKKKEAEAFVRSSGASGARTWVINPSERIRVK